MARTFNTGLLLINVGNNGNCNAIHAVGNVKSLRLTVCGTKFELAFDVILSRFVIRVLVFNLSAVAVLYSVVCNCHNVYGFPREAEHVNCLNITNCFVIKYVLFKRGHNQSKIICLTYQFTLICAHFKHYNTSIHDEILYTQTLCKYSGF